jgi:hypothetical protein
MHSQTFQRSDWNHLPRNGGGREHQRAGGGCSVHEDEQTAPNEQPPPCPSPEAGEGMGRLCVTTSVTAPS